MTEAKANADAIERAANNSFKADAFGAA